MSMSDEKLRSYVRLLVEEDYGDFGGYGFDPGSSSMAKAFGLTGLMDIGKTLLYGIEKMSSKAQHLIGTTATAVASSLIPFVEGKYKELDEAEKRRSEQLKAKYKDVFERVDKEFYEKDFRVASFLYNPVSYLASMAGIRAPGAALDVLDTVTARNNYVSAFTDAIRNRFNISSRYTKGKTARGGDLEARLADMFGEAMERDHEEQVLLEAGLTPKNMMKMILGQDKIRRVLANSKYIKQMQADAEKMIKQKVNGVVNQTKSMVQGLSLESLSKVAGGKVDMQAINKLEGNEKANAEKALVQHAKGIVKEVAKKRLSEGAKDLPDELKGLVQRGVEAIEAL